MPTLPKSLGVVRAAVAASLLHPHHAGRLYGAADLAIILNIAADVDGNVAVSVRVDASLLRRAFANDAADEFVLSYNEHFHRRGNRSVLYIRREIEAGQKRRHVLLLGQFSSLEVARFADVVRWNVAMDEEIRSGFISFLEEASKPKASKKKRSSASISPDDQSEGGNTRSISPLVAIQPRRPDPKPSPSVIYYTLDGRVGKMALPTNGLILERKLRENLLPPAYNTIDDENSTVMRSYCPSVYGSAAYWAPTGVVGVPRHHLSRLQARAKVATQ